MMALSPTVDGPTLALIALVAGALLAALCGLLARRERDRCRRRQRSALWLLQGLRTLLSDIQKHRGLSNGYHAGDPAALRGIPALQGQIKQQIAGLARRPGARCDAASWLAAQPRWQQILADWRGLASGFQGLEPELNLRCHNRLIAALLYLIEDSMVAHPLQRLGGTPSAGEARWRELLVTAEFVGQARALGTGVTAAGHCSSVARIRLNYLRMRIKQAGARCGVQPQLAALLRCIEQEVVCERPSIASQRYFALATATLDQVFARFDQAVAELARS